ncbi:hypothetical protein GGTG_12547 [Gaeumannomyces tritici R3-111a-1]|uniref:Uncharacterized protein n=1 Tax=Gaeumannomyces tritici (strain R3-111a-1) TaxID=644352 RepID=J3PGC2_GAET3|nr:hypothetical protein GGTG_12547 [Gaeumannomyces tritici R3-111a-1]EJT69663.1 hypothetical protein GGTG_12547 [Gaeumannomyces tritici R3-111a-1]
MAWSAECDARALGERNQTTDAQGDRLARGPGAGFCRVFWTPAAIFSTQTPAAAPAAREQDSHPTGAALPLKARPTRRQRPGVWCPVACPLGLAGRLQMPKIRLVYTASHQAPTDLGRRIKTSLGYHNGDTGSGHGCIIVGTD